MSTMTVTKITNEVIKIDGKIYVDVNWRENTGVAPKIDGEFELVFRDGSKIIEHDVGLFSWSIEKDSTDIICWRWL